jgi:hypothetical protein
MEEKKFRIVPGLKLNDDVSTNDISRKIALELLKSQYEATILAGWEMAKKYPMRQGANKLILTSPGSGILGNVMNLIYEAVGGCGDLIVKSGLCVYFIYFDEHHFVSSINDLKPLLDQTGGRIMNSREEI